MSGTATKERGKAITDPFRNEDFQQKPEQLPALRPAGARVDAAQAQIITAQRVAIKRDIEAILRDLKATAAAAGDRFFYSIPFKQRDRRTGTEETVYVEGISIKGAMAVASRYGNCEVVPLVAEETPTHWLFAARFVDYETGFTVIRNFQQRKNQSSGMKDAGRQLDIVFQIGQSKAMRNVIVAALPMYCEEAFDAAKSKLTDRIAKNPGASREWLAAQFEQLQVPLALVERRVSRPIGGWTVADMAKLYVQVKTVLDGMADADEFWPAPEAGEEENTGNQQAEQEQQQQGQQDEGAAAAEEDPAAAEPEQQEEQAQAKPAEEAKPKAEAKPAAAKKPAPAKEADEGLNFGG